MNGTFDKGNFYIYLQVYECNLMTPIVVKPLRPPFIFHLNGMSVGQEDNKKFCKVLFSVNPFDTQDRELKQNT